MLKHKILAFFFFFSSFVLINSVFSQEKLSLSDAIQVGLERNYDIRIEQQNVQVAENNNSWGEAGRYPKIDLTLNQNNSLQDNVKTAFPTATQGETVVNTLSPGVALNWTLFNGFAINISKYRLAKLQEESQGNADIVIANTLQAIILGYYKAVLEKERLDEFGKQLKLSGDKYRYVKIKSELGSAVSTELLLEEGNYLNDSTNYINQQLVYRNAMRDLTFLLGGDVATDSYELTDSLDFEPIEYTLEGLLAMLEAENVDLRKQYITQSILSHDLQLRKAARYPTVSLNAGFNDNRQRLDLSNATFFTGDGFASGPGDALNAITDTYFANFTVSFTLFNGGKINRAIKNAMIQENIGTIRIDRLKKSLSRDLVQAHDQYNIRRQLYGINLKKYEAAQTNLSISEEKFKNGTINSFDYRTVQNNNLSAAIQKLQSLYNLIDANLGLMRLTGGIIKTYNK